MDRSMALSLGRAPNIQDYDIQTDRLAFPGDIDSPIGPMLACWVDVADLQGQTYHQLYSAQAQNSSTTYPPSATYPTQSTYDDESHGLSALPLPPSDLVLKILKRAKGISQSVFATLQLINDSRTSKDLR